MAKYLSNLLKNLRVGIKSYTDNKTVLSVTGNLGINTSKAQSALDVFIPADQSKWFLSYGDVGIHTSDQYFSGVAFDSLGNIYASGADGTNGVPYVIKFNGSGSIVWQKFFENPDPDRQTSYCEAVAVDKSTDDFYIGIHSNDVVNSITLVKLNSSGDILWQNEINDIGNETPTSIGIGTNGDVHLAGTTSSQGSGSTDALIIKFDSSGNELWQKVIGNVNADSGNGVALDSADNVYIAGTTDTGTDDNGFIVKLDSSGTELWQKTIGDIDTENGFSVAVDSLDNVYVVGDTLFFGGSNSAQFIVKFDSSGNELWQKTVNGVNYDGAFGIAIDSQDIIYVSGHQAGDDIAITAFTSSGDVLWKKSITDRSNGQLGQNYNFPTKLIDVSDGRLIVGGFTANVENYYNSNAFLLHSPADLENVIGAFNDFISFRNHDLNINYGLLPIVSSSLTVSTSTIGVSASGFSTLTTPPTFSEVIDYLKPYSILTNGILDANFLETENFILNDVPFGKTNADLNNFIVGAGAGYDNITGSRNVFIGNSAGRQNTSGNDNNFLGYRSGYHNISGYNNNFFGDQSGYSNSSGYNNNFLGNAAGYFNINGNYNNFFGAQVGYHNSDGSYNNFIGSYSGYCNTTGSCNNLLGCESGFNNTSGNNNNFIGSGAGYCNTTGNTNNFIGLRAGRSNTSGSSNNFFGLCAGYSNVSGANNTFVGSYAGYSSTAGNANNFIGNGAGYHADAGSYNNFIGQSAGYYTTGSSNNFFGLNSGYYNTTGSYNNFFASYSGYCNTTGTNNNFIGLCAGRSNTTGSCNNFIGYQAGYGNITGIYNNFFGSNSGYYNTGSCNLILGNSAGYCNTGCLNIFIGCNSGYSNTGCCNNFFGQGSGYHNTGNDNNFFGNYAGYSNTNGGNNNFIGRSAGYSNTTGSYNNFLGADAGRYNTTGYNNAFLGGGAGRYNTTGYFNAFLGDGAGYYNTQGYYNNFFGVWSGWYNTTGNSNNFFGKNAGYNNTIGNKNINIGFNGGYSNQIGSNNTYLGSYSGISTSASNKIIFGRGYNNSNLFDAPDTTKDTQFAVGIRTDANPSKYWLVGNENFNVGIGTTNPQTKLQINGVLGFGTFISPFGPFNRTSTDIRIGDNTTGANSTDGYDNIFMGIGAGYGRTGVPYLANSHLSSYTTILGEANKVYNNVPTTGGSGSGATFVITRNSNGAVQSWGLVNTGYNYQSGDVVTIDGSSVGGVSGIDDVTITFNVVTNSTGYFNNFLGRNAGYNNATGSFNNFFGGESGHYNTTGGGNNFFGAFAGHHNTFGYFNNFLGNSAGFYNTSGYFNNFVGNGAGFYNTTGIRNTFLGYYAGNYNTTGSNNTVLGSWTGISTSASRKVILGSGYDYNSAFDAPDTTKDTQFAVGIRTDANPSKYWLVGNENFNVGIGTTNPTTKLQVGGVLGFGPKNNIKIGNNATGAVADDPINTFAIDNIFIGVGAGNSSIGGYNVYFGRYAGANGGEGAFNFFGGYRAGYGSKNAYNNVFIGSAAGGYGNNFGDKNNFIGYYVGVNNTSGGSNNFFGNSAGYNNTTGSYNSFFGSFSGAYNTTGSRNNAFGGSAGIKNLTGNYNNFFGGYTGIHTNTSYRVVLGQGYAASNNNFDVPKNADIQFAVGVRTSTAASKYWLVGNENFNVGIGTTNPQTKLQIGGVLGFGNNFNVRIGDNTTGANLDNYAYSNFLVGSGAGKGSESYISTYNITSSTTIPSQANKAYNNVSSTGGSGSGATWLIFRNGSGAVDIIFPINYGRNYQVNDVVTIDGSLVGGVSNTDDIAITVTSVATGNDGNHNNFIGYQVAYYNIGGSYNNLFGKEAGYYNTTGSINNFFGDRAGYNNTTGSFNNFFGREAGYKNTTGRYNTFFGWEAGWSNTTGRSNNIFGRFAGYYNNGFYNNFFGTNAGNDNTTGSYNNFFGIGVAVNNTTGDHNNFFGSYAGKGNTTGSKNTFLGSYSGISTSASRKVILGSGYNYSNLFDSPDTTKDTQFAVGVRTDANPSKYWLVGNENFNVGIGETNPTEKLTVGGNVLVSGDVTASNFVGNLTGTATTATSVTPNSVTLGTDTVGDYVQSISGTANEINVTGGTGESSTPVISFAPNPTIGGNVTVGNDLQVNNNLNINGNITIGGTAAYLIVNEFRVKDADIVAGFTTDIYNNEVSSDTTANHGGIAVASTEGSPLVTLYNPDIGETNPATYKKIMWFKSGAFAGLNTDAWLINYAVGIGSTQFPAGTRLAAGAVQFTEKDLAVVRDINASGIVTGNTFRPTSGYIQAADGTNSFYIYGGTGNVAFQGTIGASQINNASGYKALDFGTTTTPSVNITNNLLVGAGGTVITTTTGGFVGVGTTNPQTKLEIDGILGFSTFVVFGQSRNNIRIGDKNTGKKNDGYDNIFIGAGAGQSMGGNSNISIGQEAGRNTEYTYRNISIGDRAGFSIDYGGHTNVLIGLQAAEFPSQYLQTSNIIGERAGQYAAGVNNNFFGTYAGQYSTGNHNNFMGFNAGSYNTGNYNIAFGAFVYYGGTGSYNNAFGYAAGSYNTTGSHNNFFGATSGKNNTVGSRNTFLGSYTGISTSASRKVILGSGTYSNLFDSPDTKKDTQFAVGIRTDANPSKYWLVGNENFNIGIGTTNPQTKLEIGGVLGFGNNVNVRIGDNDTGANLGIYAYSNFLVGSGAGRGVKSYINNANLTSSTTIPSEANKIYSNVPATGGSGSDATFTIFRNGSGAVFIVAPSNRGRNYQLNNVLTIDGSLVGGVSGTDNITLTVTSVSDSSGAHNNFFGTYAGYYNAYGSYNNFFGYLAGYYNQAGSHNNFFGYKAGYYNVDGRVNNFIGQQAGYYNTSGRYNNFFGDAAGESNTNGWNNDFIGRLAGNLNTTGSFNDFIGSFAGERNTTGSYNNFLGFFAGSKNRTGNCNNFFGSYSGISTSASRKVILGSGYNYSNLFDSPDTTKDTQFAVGVRTDANPSKYWLVGNENFNVGIGTTNPQTKLEINGVLGFSTFKNIFDDSVNNIRIGDKTTGANLTSGYGNIFIGIDAGSSTTSGWHNSFFGDGAGYYNTTGTYNNFIGYGAGYFSTIGANNSFFGTFAGGYNTTGTGNNFFGSNAGGYNTTGNSNNFFGYSAGVYNTTGSKNTFLGSYSGISTSASNKVIFGSGYNFSNLFDSPDTTKDFQFAVGIRTDANPSKYWLVGNENFNIGIGTTNPTSKLTVGGDAYFSGIVTATDFNSASDIRLKENISVIENPLDKIVKLEGVNFNWKNTGKKSSGVIAQEVEKVLPELVSGDESKTVNYNGLIGLLIECVKKQQEEIDELRRLIDK